MSKIALVTGAGSGIGRAVALKLLSAGYAVALAGRRRETLDQTSALAPPGARRLCVVADVSQEAAVDTLFDTVLAQYGRLDVLFNNAGIGAPAVPIDELSPSRWHEVVAVNLTGTFLCARAAFRIMKRQQPAGGRIINNGSISAHMPRAHSAPYTATKHAITGLTKSLALDGRAHGIACGQIDIGNAATDMIARLPRAEPTMDVSHVAEAVLQIANLPLDVNVPFMTIMATQMPYMGRG